MVENAALWIGVLDAWQSEAAGCNGREIILLDVHCEVRSRLLVPQDLQTRSACAMLPKTDRSRRL